MFNSEQKIKILAQERALTAPTKVLERVPVSLRETVIQKALGSQRINMATPKAGVSLISRK